MASGTISLGTKSNLRGRILWTSESKGSAANTSVVTAELQARKTSNTTIATEGNWTGSLNIGGTSKSFTKLKGVNSNDWVTLHSFSVTVSHDSLGKGTCYIYGKIKGPAGTSLAGYSVSGSETVALDDIPRFATITSAPNFNDEQDPTIGFSNPAGSNATSVEACISLDGAKADVAYKPLGNATSGSYTFSLTPGDREVLLKATTKNSRTVYFIIRTVIGGSTGEIKYPVTFTVKDPKPEITPTIQDVNEKTKDLTGDSSKLVRYFSNAQITIGAEAQKESTITSQKVTNGSKSLTADGTIQAVESASFTFAATDSRGNTTTKTVTQEFVSYIKPTCQMANNIPDAEGAMTVKATGNYFNGSFGAKSNHLTVSYRYKAPGGTYGQWTEMAATLSGNTYTATADLTVPDYLSAYVFQVRAEDALTSVNSAEKTVKATPVFDWGENDFQFHVPVFGENGKLLGRTNVVTQAGTDLNDYTEEGWYVFNSSHTPANIPAGSNGWLRVVPYNSSYVKQIWYRWGTAGTNDYQTFVRSKSGDTWGKWWEFMTSAGGTLNGALSIGYAGYPSLYFRNADGVIATRLYPYANPDGDNDHRFVIAEYDVAGTGYYERYRLPVPAKNMTASISYDILTTKNALPIAYEFPNQTSTFNAQTVKPSGYANYDAMLVCARLSTNTAIEVPPVLIRKGGNGANLYGVLSGKIVRRTVTFTEDGIEFAAAGQISTYGGSFSNLNTSLIPTVMYGLKGVV